MTDLSDLVPDILDGKLDDSDFGFAVTFGKTKVSNGQELTVAETQATPSVSWKADDKTLYTLLCVDPDAPSRKEQKFKSWRHWALLNIPGSKLVNGYAAAPYMGPGPPKGTGLHRYAFLLYKQPGEIKGVKMNNEGMSRGKWDHRAFAKEHGIGSPVAAVYFQAQNK